MATAVYTVMQDDIDGTTDHQIKPGKTTVVTRTFMLDGERYAIDVNERHSAELDDTLAKYIARARRSSTNGGRAGRRPGRPAVGPVNGSNDEIRAWAKTVGHEVKDRGRIPANIVAEFKAAHS